MQQIIVAKNDNEEVWVQTPTGHLLTECFFKAPDETPEELEHRGYPQLLHLYPPEAIRVGPGIAPEEVDEIFVEARAEYRQDEPRLQALSYPHSYGITTSHYPSE